MMLTDQAPALIVVIPLMCALLTPIIGLVKKELCHIWVLFALALSTAFAVSVLLAVISHGPVHYYMGGWMPPWGIEYVIDHLNALMLVLVTGTALVVAFYSPKSIERELPDKLTYFYTVFLLQVTGFLGIVITGDVFNLYVFLEVASLAGYALIAAGEEGAPLASFRYLILGTIGACFYLIGAGYLYIVTGSLNMADLAAALPELYHSKVILVAFAFFMVGIALKMALFPLHMWLPDAYTKAPSVASALIAPLMTKIAVYIMLRIMFTVFRPSFSFEILPVSTIMVVTGIAAILVGAVMALAQIDFKRMLCYIIVAEVGYMVGGIGLANETAIKGAILHVLNDVVMTLGLFAVAGIITYVKKSHNLSDFQGAFKKMPFTMAAFTVIGLSVIGVPPTCGFFSKWYLIQGSVIAGNWYFVAALLFSSLINIVLFFRILEIGYYDQGDHGNQEKGAGRKFTEAPVSMLVPALFIAVLIILIGFYNQPIILGIIQHSVPTL
ncbi:MAG: monovalent cation/H+ antiporter subunit D family protein [Syntrophales bacterium]|jgi:multicomponent Na+:H+ antiporter subunit D|nr:monovalent cation/H+ antiporter subunit D family protein [Syntrophales bacterium]MDY0043262.1 monovalent cation/H+ antiporter subunit D family protein [Syntrophales bacterium]